MGIRPFDELTKAEQKVAGIAQDVIKAERKAKLQMPTAPIDGIVQQLVVRTVGGVVAPAQPLAVVVPRGMRESSGVRRIRGPCAA